MAVTMQEIAEIAGVSRGTVDRALNDRGRINPQVAKKIKKIARELDYIPKKKRGETAAGKKIGVITQLSGASFMIRVKQGLEDAAEELLDRKIEVIVEDCEGVDEKEQLAAMEKLIAKGVSGIAMMPVESNLVREKINQLEKKSNVPVVTFNSDIVGTKRVCFVGQDNKKSGKTAAGLMGLVCGGEGRVLVITGHFGNSVSSMRVEGFVEELKHTYPGMELAGVHSSFDNSGEVEKIIFNTMQVFPDLSGIVVVSGGQNGIRKAFDKMGLKKRPYTIIYDLTPGNESLLMDDMADFLIDQNGYAQGYQALCNLADILQKKNMVMEEFQYTDIVIKTKYNI